VRLRHDRVFLAGGPAGAPGGRQAQVGGEQHEAEQQPAQILREVLGDQQQIGALREAGALG
jgi:hypothetical protein